MSYKGCFTKLDLFSVSEVIICPRLEVSYKKISLFSKVRISLNDLILVTGRLDLSSKL